MIAAIPSPHDPLTPVNWRWERARWLREKGRSSRRDQDDQFTLVARDYQVAERAAQSRAARERLVQRYPGVHWAWEIRQSGLQAQRWALEAFLLARERPARIARLLKTSTEVVLWYEKLFFNVRPHLHNELYIVNAVFSESVHRGLTEREYDLLWKMVGFAMGPIALRHLILPMQPIWVGAEDQLKPSLEAQIDAQIARKTLIGAHTLPVAYNQHILFEAYRRCREIDKALGQTAPGEALIAQNIQAALAAMPLRVGSGGQRVAAENLPYEEAAAEIRAGEQIELSPTGTITGGQDFLTYNFPEPADGAPTNPSSS